MTKPIRITGRTPPLEIEQQNVFFTFGSGRLSYDCVSCNSTCCRGHGYSLGEGSELEAQLALRPGMKLFLDTRSGAGATGFHVRNCPPACFFLQSDGLCHVHARHGFAAKPDTCKHFPFNNVRRVGPYLVVAPHESLCPLRVEPSGRESGLSSHVALLETMSAYGMSSGVSDYEVRTGDTHAAIALERAVATAAEGPLRDSRYSSFVVEQLQLTSGMGKSTDRQVADMSRERLPAVDRLIHHVESLMGIDAEAADTTTSGIDQTFVALTPLLRSRYVFGLTAAKPGARTLMPRIETVPLILLGGHVVTRGARAAGLEDVGFQTIMRIFRDFDPLLRLFGQLDEVVMWRPRVTIPFPVIRFNAWKSRYVSLAKALLPSLQRRMRRTLAEMLHACVPEDDIERILFLKQVGSLLVDRIAPLTAAGDEPSSPSGRSALQRLAVRTLSTDVLCSMYDRLSTASSTPRI